jgi:arylsulfatase A
MKEVTCACLHYIHAIWVAASVCLALAYHGTSAQDLANNARPNIIVFLCDDLGRGDLGCYGNDIIQTPNLDALAAGGIMFTDCYAASPVCSPSRAGLLTGRIPNRTGVYDWIAGSMYLPEKEVTIAEQLKKAGYHTGVFGKWHLTARFNSDAEPGPGEQGFDYWFATKSNAGPSHENPTNFIRNGERVGKIIGYSADIIAEETVGWIDNVQGEPFFAYVAFHEPHEPIASDPFLVEQYQENAEIPGQDLYYANVAQIDRAVGKVMAFLKRRALEENTLVFFTSDNGPETWMRYPGAWRSHGTPGEVDGAALRGMKLHMTEGGIRVPGILHWPRKIAPRVEHMPISSIDLFPTFCALAGVDLPFGVKLDGESMVPLLEDRTIIRQQPLFWFYYNAFSYTTIAMREGDYMMLARRTGEHYYPGTGFEASRMEAIKTSTPRAYELYNLAEDVGQTRFVQDTVPSVYEKMKKQIDALFYEIQEESPVWDQ